MPPSLRIAARVVLGRKFAQRSPTDLAADQPEVLALLARYKVTSESSRGQGDGAPGGTERKVSDVTRLQLLRVCLF